MTLLYIIIEWQNFFVGLLSSFFASFALALIFFIFGKPKIELCEKVAFLNTDEFGKDIENTFLFKVRNKSLFVAYDLRANLEILKPYQVPKGTNDRAFDIELFDTTKEYLPCNVPFKKNYGKNCIIFRTKQVDSKGNVIDLNKELQNSSAKLRFTLITRNGFSGLTKVFVQFYHTKSDIKSGHFGFGKDFDIKE